MANKNVKEFIIVYCDIILLSIVESLQLFINTRLFKRIILLCQRAGVLRVTKFPTMHCALAIPIGLIARQVTSDSMNNNFPLSFAVP